MEKEATGREGETQSLLAGQLSKLDEPNMACGLLIKEYEDNVTKKMPWCNDIKNKIWHSLQHIPHCKP